MTEHALELGVEENDVAVGGGDRYAIGGALDHLLHEPIERLAGGAAAGRCCPKSSVSKHPGSEAIPSVRMR
jgi:hypothetical protein